MTTPLTSPVHTLASSSQMQELLGAIDQGVARIRFAEGLRSGWQAARAEASVRLAFFEADLVGARTDLDQLRLATLGRVEVDDPALAQALDIWKAHRLVEQQWPPLNSKRPVRTVTHPLPNVVSSIHKALTARWSNAGKIDQADVAVLKDPQAWRTITWIMDSNLPAPMRAGLIVWVFANREVFASHSVQVAHVLVRHHLVMKGFEPSGTLLTSRQLIRDAKARLALKDADPSTWLLAYCEAMATAVDPTLELIRNVQAKSLS